MATRVSCLSPQITSIEAWKHQLNAMRLTRHVDQCCWNAFLESFSYCALQICKGLRVQGDQPTRHRWIDWSLSDFEGRKNSKLTTGTHSRQKNQHWLIKLQPNKTAKSMQNIKDDLSCWAKRIINCASETRGEKLGPAVCVVSSVASTISARNSYQSCLFRGSRYACWRELRLQCPSKILKSFCGLATCPT